MAIAQSGHGALVYRSPGPALNTYTKIAQVGDFNFPELMRNDFDAVTQDIDIDTFVTGVLRRNELSLTLNFLPTDGTHDEVTGLINALRTNSFDGYKFTTPSASSVWIASGYCKGFAPKMPKDGLMSADVKLRLSGQMWINGVLIG